MGQNGSSNECRGTVFARIWVPVGNSHKGSSGQWQCRSISTGQGVSVEDEMHEAVQQLWTWTTASATNYVPDGNSRQSLASQWPYRCTSSTGKNVFIELVMAPIESVVVELQHPQEFGDRRKSLWPSDSIWRHRSELALVEGMHRCLMALSHYMNQCRPFFTCVLWYSLVMMGQHFPKSAHELNP